MTRNWKRDTRTKLGSGMESLEKRIVLSAEPLVDIGDGRQTVTRVDTDVSDFVRVIGKSNHPLSSLDNFKVDNDELEETLKVLLQGKKDQLGVDGVKLVSLSKDEFTIGLNGFNNGSFVPQIDFIHFSGEAVEDAIESVLHVVNGTKYGLDLKNKNSQVTFFDTDVVNSIFIGSGSQTSAEMKEIIGGGSKLSVDEMQELFVATVTGKAKNDTAGVEGVEVIGLTDSGFTLRINGSQGTVDTIIVEGEGALEAILMADAAKGADLKDGHTAFDVFDAETETREFIGGTSGELRDIIGGVFHRDEILDLYEGITSGKWSTAGVDNVELIGLNSTSFAIKVTSAGGNHDYILFKNVHLLEGAAALGFIGPV